MREPRWEPVCECKYDEARDEMDREDCLLHCEAPDREALPVQRKMSKPAGTVKDQEVA